MTNSPKDGIPASQEPASEAARVTVEWTHVFQSEATPAPIVTTYWRFSSTKPH